MNKYIGLNKEAGIKVGIGCHPSIVKNHIGNNFQEGILMVESSSAHIENNLIERNVKANIAFGGKQNSQNTIIINNRIKCSANEGIIVVNNGRSQIIRNLISGN